MKKMEFSALPYLVTVVTILVSICPGNTEHVCDFDKHCLNVYTNMKAIFEQESTSDMTLLCSLSQELKECMKRVARRCRGDLNYHFFEKLVRDLNSNIGVGKSCNGGFPKGASGETNSSRSRIPSSSSSSGEEYLSHHERRFRPRGSWGNSHETAVADKCAKPALEDARTVGCALFGLTNLKSFSETLNYTDINYCSLAGAWNLIDTPEFAVQITNKGGLSPLPKDITATTLVTVIVKANDCSERKTYQATFDEVPGMFSDGYTTAANVYIQTIVESEHVKIHFPYIHSTIDIIKVIDKIPIPSLTVAIKMPESAAQSFMTEPDKLRGLPLCFYGCPRTATIKPSRESTGGHTARSASSVSSPTNYYRSNCPRPSSDSAVPRHVSNGGGDDELPQADSPAPPKVKEEAEFSGSLIPGSAEFLSQGEFSMSKADFGGQRSQRSSASSTAVICASLNSVQEVLSECTVVHNRLKFPGEEGLAGSSHHHRHSLDDFMSSSLVSQSAPVSQFHFVFVCFTVMLVFACS